MRGSSCSFSHYIILHFYCIYSLICLICTHIHIYRLCALLSMLLLTATVYLSLTTNIIALSWQQILEHFLLFEGQLFRKLYIERHQKITFPRRVLGEGQTVALYTFHRIRFDNLHHGADTQTIAGHCRNLEDHTAESLWTKREMGQKEVN